MIICLYHARCMVTDILMYKDQKGNVQITDAHIIMIHYIAMKIFNSQWEQNLKFVHHIFIVHIVSFLLFILSLYNIIQNYPVTKFCPVQTTINSYIMNHYNMCISDQHYILCSTTLFINKKQQQ
jgi:hypothetical protein